MSAEHQLVVSVFRTTALYSSEEDIHHPVESTTRRVLIPVALTVTETFLFCIAFAFTITLSAYTHIISNNNLLI